MKEEGELKKEIEAVLFASGRKISLDELAKLCKAEKKEADDAVKELKQDYENESSPLLLTEEADGYKLTVREKYLSIVKEITPHTELNKAMMETLAVIAWKHPALQSDVIKIRTSKAYEDIKNLVEMGFVSKEKHGRSFILKATGKFFEYFDLPNKEAVKEVFKDVKDVEPETQEKLGDLETYEAKAKEEGKEEKEENNGDEPKEKLGKFEVYSTPEEENEEKDGESEEGSAETEEETETGKEKEDQGNIEKESGQEEESDDGNEEKDDDDSGEEDVSDEHDDDDHGSKKKKEEKKKRLPKELEEFAGIDEEEEEKKSKEED